MVPYGCLRSGHVNLIIIALYKYHDDDVIVVTANQPLELLFMKSDTQVLDVVHYSVSLKCTQGCSPLFSEAGLLYSKVHFVCKYEAI